MLASRVVECSIRVSSPGGFHLGENLHAQALDFRDYTPGKGTLAAKGEIRKHVDFLDEDRPLYPDHNRMKDLVASGEILKEVEETVGPLD